MSVAPEMKITDTSNIPPVKLHLVTPPRVTIKCHDSVCGIMVRVYRIEPSTRIGAFKYCPVCGSTRVSAYMSAEVDQWESLARDYNMPVEVIKEVYKLWEPQTHYRFADFVAELRAEMAAETEVIS